MRQRMGLMRRESRLLRAVSRILRTVACALLAACSLPHSLEDPRILVAPYYPTYQLRGDTSLQSPGAPPTDNPAVQVEDFGLRGHSSDVGMRIDIGDDFDSFRVDYYRMDHHSKNPGVLPAAWGALLAADTVRLETRLDEIRVGYVGEVLREKFGKGERQVDLRLGLGGVIAWRDLRFRAREATGLRSQDVTVGDDGVVYPAARARVTWRGAYLEGEYAISPDLQFGGDYQGVQQDIEVRIGYQVPMQDVSVFAGWRWSEWNIDGFEGPLHHEAELVMDGFQFGVRILF